MPANATLYLASADPALGSVVPGAKSDKSLFRRTATHFTLTVGGEALRLNVMARERMPRHLQGFRTYVAGLAAGDAAKAQVTAALARTQSVLGLVAQTDFDANPALWPALLQIASAFDGVIFAADSVFDAQGIAIVGPAARDGT